MIPFLIASFSFFSLKRFLVLLTVLSSISFSSLKKICYIFNVIFSFLSFLSSKVFMIYEMVFFALKNSAEAFLLEHFTVSVVPSL